jgi:hypothetical protein
LRQAVHSTCRSSLARERPGARGNSSARFA